LKPIRFAEVVLFGKSGSCRTLKVTAAAAEVTNGSKTADIAASRFHALGFLLPGILELIRK
jgi:hypothetical protein